MVNNTVAAGKAPAEAPKTSASSALPTPSTQKSSLNTQQSTSSQNYVSIQMEDEITYDLIDKNNIDQYIVTESLKDLQSRDWSKYLDSKEGKPIINETLINELNGSLFSITRNSSIEDIKSLTETLLEQNAPLNTQKTFS